MRYINYGRTPDQQNLVTKNLDQPLSAQELVSSSGSKGTVELRKTPTVANLTSLLSNDYNQFREQISFDDPYSAACVDNIAYKPANNQMAQDFLKRELDRIDEAYQESMEQLETANFVTDLWNTIVTYVAAPIVSLVATPLAGSLVLGIGGVIGQTASFVVEKLRDGIERGIVSPQFLDYVAMINKDPTYYVEYTEKLSDKTRSERYTITRSILENYKALQEMATLPFPAGMMFRNSATYQGTLARMEIMLSVLCDLHQQDTSSQSGSNGSNGSNGEDEGSGKGLVIAAIAALVGGALLL